MATAASTYATSISNHALFQPQWQTKRCDRSQSRSIRCNAAPERERMSPKGGVASFRRSLLAGGVALPFSLLMAENARAFVEDGSTSSEQQRRELVQTIQTRAAREESQAEEAAADAQESAKALKAAEGEKAAEVEIAAKAQEAKKAQKAADGAEAAAQKTREVEAATKAQASSVKQGTEPAANVVESVTQKVEQAAESVRSKVGEVVGSSSAKEEEAKPDLPAYGPGSARRLREANIRYPTSTEKLASSPDDINAADPVYKRLDSSKNPDLPPLFPKENYGTPWVPPADEPKDKIKIFWGPWDIGPAPEKVISRPFKEPEDFEDTIIPLSMGLTSIAIAAGAWIWNLGKPAVNWDLLEDPTGVVQQMRAEKVAFDAAEAERIARGESAEGSETVKEDKH